MFNILVVDDRDAVLESIELILEDNAEYNLLFADCAETAVNLADEHEIDLILLDLIVPHVRGADLLRTLWGYCCNVLIISAASQTRIAAGLLQCGVRDYVNKPFDADDLEGKVADALLCPAERQPLLVSDELQQAIIDWRKIKLN